MFNINFISKPGLKENTSDECWSFLMDKGNAPSEDLSIDKITKKPFIINDTLKNYVFVLISFGLIVLMSFMNTRFLQLNPDMVLNEVFDLIIESGYMDNIELQEVNFDQNQILVIIKSKEIQTIQNLEKIDNLENMLSSEIYQKGLFSYLNILFPWDGNKKGGDLEMLKSMIDKIIFSNDIVVNHTDNTFQFKGKISDIVTFLLQMVENQQIQKFNFSIFQHELNNYNFILDLDLP